MTKPTGKTTKPRCIICGKTEGVKTHILPHGRIKLCMSYGCQKHVSMFLDDPQRSVPIMWVSYQDFLDHEHLSPAILEKLKDDGYRINAADSVSSFLWDYGDTMGQMFGEALSEIANEIEQWYVKELTDVELPTIDMDSLKSEAARAALETRLKGDKPA